MHIERLMRMIEILKNVKEQKRAFDMDQWFGDRDQGCGTAACAFGYGALDPAFQAEGLRLIFTDTDKRKHEILNVEDYYALRNKAGTVEPAFAGRTGFGAACVFFDIPMSTADYLFNAANYNGLTIAPKRVIKRLGKVLGIEPEQDR